MTRPLASWLAAASVAMTLLLPAASFAQAAPEAAGASRTERARDAFRRGTELAALDRWAEAVDAFTESAAMIPHASTTYNIGYAELGLGRRTRARRAFQRALEEDAARGKRELDASQRAAASRYLEQIAAELGILEVSLPSDDVALAIDGRPLTRAGAHRWIAGLRDLGESEAVPAHLTIEVDPGTHQLTFERDKETGRQTVSVAKGGRTVVALQFAPAPDSPPDVRPPVARPGNDLRATARTRTIAAYTVGGVSAGLVATGAVLGGVALARWNEALDGCPDRVRCRSDEPAQLSHDASRFADLSTAAFVVGGAGLAGAAILWLTAPDVPNEAPEAGNVSLAPAPGGLGLRVRW